METILIDLQNDEALLIQKSDYGNNECDKIKILEPSFNISRIVEKATQEKIMTDPNADNETENLMETPKKKQNIVIRFIKGFIQYEKDLKAYNRTYWKIFNWILYIIIITILVYAL